MNDVIDAGASGPESDRPRLRFSQETITIVTTAVAIAGLLLFVTNDIRDDISELRVETRADRQAFREEMHLLRAEARADRERADAAHRQFEAQILKLAEGQAQLAAIVDSTD